MKSRFLIVATALAINGVGVKSIAATRIVCENLAGGETLQIVANESIPRSSDHVPRSIRIPVQIVSNQDPNPYFGELTTSYTGRMRYSTIVRDQHRRLILEFSWEDSGTGSYMRPDAIQLLDGKCRLAE